MLAIRKFISFMTNIGSIENFDFKKLGDDNIISFISSSGGKRLSSGSITTSPVRSNPRLPARPEI